jgi:thiol reductant ABC exporter CydD subunit
LRAFEGDKSSRVVLILPVGSANWQFCEVCGDILRPVRSRRLLYRARSTRLFILLCVALGVLGAGLVIAQAVLLATAIASVFQAGASLTELRPALVALAAVIGGRAVLAWAQEAAAHRAAATVKTELRGRLLTHVAALGPGWLRGERSGQVTVLATRGVDALDAYFARYLPQLVLAALVPAAVVVAMLPVDLIAGLTILVTVPLIPVFLALVGQATQAASRRQFGQLLRLAHHVLEILAGLPTLKAFGRAAAQAATIQALSDRQRRTTMQTLRLAFVSSLVLELLATLSVALVAVGIGLRLVHGSLDLRTALIALILAPEAYLPLRTLAATYHASEEGLAAAAHIGAILDSAPPFPGTRQLPARTTTVRLEGVTVEFPDRTEAALRDFSLTVAPGELIVLAGPSGSGKSTVLSLILGFVEPAAGQVTLGGVDLSDVDMSRWRASVAWVPQHPYLLAGTVADNIRLGRPDASDAEVSAAARLALVADLLSTVVGSSGTGLSTGQGQRVALARAFLRDAPLLLLDEPTAALDESTEQSVLDAIRGLAADRAVLLVAHRPAALAVADRVVRLTDRTQVLAA